MDNRRRHPRIPLVTMARISPHGIQKPVNALVRDISTEGMGVYAEGPYQKGDVLLVEISIKTDRGEIISEALLGMVAWTTPLQETNRYAVGLEFHNMEKKNPVLYAYIKHLEGLQNTRLER